MLNIVVLVSGGGTNLQALINAQNSGSISNGKITRVISDKEGAFALTRAENAGIETSVVARKSFASIAEHNKALLNELLECNADLIVLAGYLSILDKEVTDAFANKIINVHPSLIPAFCGDGFYGLRVHK
ncbi:MAG: formyltransferase family protein, partial [Oscillospiraceae bacterium]